MQDGKALQAGTSHYLGTTFSEAAGIKYQDREGAQQFCHTTSWGVSTRLIGGVIMTHGDDDGLRVPPAIAPFQVVIIPMLRDKPEDAELIAYCAELQGMMSGANALGERVRIMLDKKPGKAAAKRWDWVRKGAPIIIEVGGRDMENGVISLLRRDKFWNAEGKANFQTPSREDAAAGISAMLEDIQKSLYDEARARRDANITRGVTSFAQLEEMFADGAKYPGWAEVEWAKPTGVALDEVVEKLKTLKLTIRNVPLGAEPPSGTCLFTGAPAVERIYIARSY